MADRAGTRRDSLPTDPRWDEGELVREIKAGSEAALRVLLGRHWTDLVRYALTFVEGQDAAEDIVQEAFVRLWRRRRTWRQEETLTPVLYRVTRNLALNETRRRANFRRWAKKLRRSEEDPRPSPHRKMQQADLAATVHQAVADLPERRREIFQLVRVHRMTYREAGKVLDISPQTVANQMSRAMTDLREALEPYLLEADSEEIPFPRKGAG